MPGPSSARVRELVGGACRGDDYLAAARLDCVLSHPEGEFAIMNDEYLGVGVCRLGPLPGGVSETKNDTSAPP